MGRRTGFLVWVAALLSLAGCGGGGSGGSGGSDTLFVSVSYSNTPLELFAPAAFAPSLSGFQGHAASCALTSGSPPPGMTLRSDCVVAGTPTQAGNFSFGMRLGASGAGNTLDTIGAVTVRGPGVFYNTTNSFLTMINVGDVINDVPLIANWIAPGGVPLTWSFAVQTGSLPPGLRLDPSTGVISGTVTATGSYYATVQARLTTSLGSYTPTISNYQAAIGIETFSYFLPSHTAVGGGPYAVAFVSQPVAGEPMLTTGGTLSAFALLGPALPAGLMLDPATGFVTGTPQLATPGDFYPMSATLTKPSISYAVTGALPLEVIYPVVVTYPFGTHATAGAAVAVAPDKNVVSNTPVPGASYSYAPFVFEGNSQCLLPAGVTLNATTGVVSGSTTAIGGFGCFVEVTIVNNGVAWTAMTQAYFTIDP